MSKEISLHPEQQSSQMLHAVIQASPLAVLALDREGNVTLWNHSAERLFGWSEKEALGHPPPIVPPDKLDEFYALCRRVLRGESLNEVELVRQRRDGSPMVISLCAAPLYDAAGSVSGIMALTADITERKRAEERLRQTQVVLENSPLVLFRWSGAGGVEFVSENVAQFGYTAEELMSGRMSFDAIVHPDDLPHLKREGEATAARGEKALHREYRLITRDGRVRWVDDRTSIVRGPDGKVNYSEGILLDITERKEMERALRDSEAKYRALVEHVPAMSYVSTLAPTPHTLYISPQVEPMLGFSVEEWLADPELWFKRVHSDDLQFVMAEATRSYRTGEPFRCEYRLLTRDERVLWVRDEGTIVRDEAGQPRFLHGIMLDITERKQMEAELRRLKEFNEGIVCGVEEGLILEDAAGIITFVNPGMEKLLGYTADELIGSHWRKLVAPQEIERIQAKVAQRPAGVAEQYEAWLLHKDGHEVPALLSTRPLFRDGVFVGVLTACMDISARVQAEAERDRLEVQLREAQKLQAVGQLAGGVAHQFNNLLTAVMGNAELALENPQLPEEVRQDLHTIQNTAQRAASLAQQLLAFGQRQMMRPQRLDVNVMAEDMAQMLGGLLGERITLQVSLAPEAGDVLADRSALQQILLNLALNARDAMPEGGTLRIATAQVTLDEAYCAAHPEARPGQYALLSVADTGKGMDEATRQRLFEPFFTTKGPGEGQGLGLAVVYGIVKQHGGFIEVASEPGKGTRFDVFLPCSQTVGVSETPTVSPPKVSPLRGRETILLAEDEELVRDMAKTMLEKLGYSVLLVRDGQEAVELFSSDPQRVDMLILDAVMPRLDGHKAYEALRRIRSDVPVLFITGYSPELVASPLRAGERLPVLRKPFSMAELGRKVREALGGE